MGLFLNFDTPDFKLKQLELVPFERKKFRLNYASEVDCQWLLKTLQKQSAPFNTYFTLQTSRRILAIKTDQ
jgi:hypothetical protein